MFPVPCVASLSYKAKKSCQRLKLAGFYLHLHVLYIYFIFQSKKQYEKAFKESEKAAEMYRKADADINLSRADVERV